MTEAFEGSDFYELDDLLTEEEKMIRDSVRELVTREVMPCIVEATREGVFPEQVIKPIAEMGLLGANLEGYGCAGLGPIAYGLAMQELERGDSGVRSFVSVQGALAMWPIYAYGSEEQKQHWLPRMATGEAIGCFGLTEPDFGSNPGGMLTRAVKDGNEWVLNGAKMWITNGTMADVAVVWARTEDGIRGFLVEKGTPGYSTQQTKGKFSLRASDTSELIFDDCRIPEHNQLLGAEGLKGPLNCLTQARYGIGWGAIGAAMACFDEVVRYSKSRIQFGKPIGSFQLVQAKLADMLTEITKAQLVSWRLGKLKEAGKAKHYHVSLAKRNNVAIALDIAREARDLLGGNGIIDEYQTMRHMCNLETVKTYEGTHNIHTLVLGEYITGIPAYR